MTREAGVLRHMTKASSASATVLGAHLWFWGRIAYVPLYARGKIGALGGLAGQFRRVDHADRGADNGVKEGAPSTLMSAFDP